MPASGHAPKSFAQPKAMEPIELLCLEDNTTQVHSSVGIDTPLFQPYPTEVRFRDYAPFSCIERTLRFRNNDHVARRIKVLQPKSPYFEVSGPHARGKDVTLKQSKVATGMEVCFVVKFRPQEVREYKVDLVCCTEREKFIVPVRAFGLRAALSLPEEVDFGTAAVKSTKQRSLLVQNIGACTAVFKLSCDTPEIFQASPSESITQVGQMATLELSFTPQKVEPYSGTLLVEFLGDETRVVTVALKGIAEDVDVHLSANSVALEPAYVSLSSQTTFRIRNASEIPVLFSWKQFSNMAEQEAERSRLHSDLERMQQLEEAHLEETLRQDELAALAHHGHGFSNQPQSDESDGDLSGDEGNVPGATRAARSALTTKYVLVVDGGDRGEYRATLTGVCKRPEPRGPFTIEAGGKCDVEFRNVFSEAREFVFTVDHPEFAVATGKANINARSPYTASVSFTPVDPADGSAPPPVVTARMLVDCVDPAGEKQSWTYYLRGQRKAD